MVDAGLTVIQDSIGSTTPENTGELIKFSHANNNNKSLLLPLACAYPVLVLFPTKLALLLGSSCLTSLLSGGVLKACFEFAIFGTA